VTFDHVWFWNPRRQWDAFADVLGVPREPDRKGLRCRVLAHGAKNTVLVEFEDGTKLTTSRYAVRRAELAQPTLFDLAR
jgi:hypothetical protein